MRFRPCIDLHQGRVKQIVGSTLGDGSAASLQVNFSTDLLPSHYARMYRRDGLSGGHVIMLGPGNEEAARDALTAWPGGLQVGGGITADNALQWLQCGASHVIVTSYVFYDGALDVQRLQRLCETVGKERLVLDLSCRWRDDGYYVVTDRWQSFSQLRIDASVLSYLAGFCDEFLVHAVDVEGKCCGIDEALIRLLAEHSPIATTYAGGVATLNDLERIRDLGQGRIDATVGSSLDIFGGRGCTYQEVVAFHHRENDGV